LCDGTVPISMSAPLPVTRAGRRKPPIPFYMWPFWMFLLALGLFVFYVVLTPVWMATRLVAWLAEGRRAGSADVR
jgi:hypothetical protein